MNYYVRIEYLCRDCGKIDDRNGGWSKLWGHDTVVEYDPLAEALEAKFS